MIDTPNLQDMPVCEGCHQPIPWATYEAQTFDTTLFGGYSVTDPGNSRFARELATYASEVRAGLMGANQAFLAAFISVFEVTPQALFDAIAHDAIDAAYVPPADEEAGQ